VNGQDEKVRLIDWHDYKKIQEDLERVGPGEQGHGVSLTPEELKLQQEMKNKLFQENGFNAIISDKISLQRSVSDLRVPE
jgi:polypeptide N-acetylgalactosaminyltransferase